MVLRDLDYLIPCRGEVVPFRDSTRLGQCSCRHFWQKRSTFKYQFSLAISVPDDLSQPPASKNPPIRSVLTILSAEKCSFSEPIWQNVVIEFWIEKKIEEAIEEAILKDGHGFLVKRMPYEVLNQIVGVGLCSIQIIIVFHILHLYLNIKNIYTK